MKNSIWGAAAVAVAMILPPPLRAQVRTLKDYHVADVETLRTKFVGLARAIPEERYDWRPMEGTRSVREVLVLVAAEANVFPANWGLPAAEGAAQGYQAESARLGGVAVTKALLIVELGRAFDHLSRTLAGMSDAARAADGRTFGRDIRVDAGITLALSDMHEHLGQLIAYARANRIVPPWSRDESNAQGSAATAADRIAEAMRAAPPGIARHATIVDRPATPGAAPAILRAGSNGWTCTPGNDAARQEGRPDPSCADERARAWFRARSAGEVPRLDGVGLYYRLLGDNGASNTDPFASGPTADNEWVETGPHIIIFVPDVADLDQLPSDPGSGGPYVMWRGTPYAHIMMPVAPAARP